MSARLLVMVDGDLALVVNASAADLDGDVWRAFADTGVSLVVFDPHGTEPWVKEQLRRGARWMGIQDVAG